MRKLLRGAALFAALTVGLTTLSSAFSGDGALWFIGRGDYYMTDRSGDATGLAAAYVGITNAGNDGYIQLGPGLEGLVLTGLPVGATVMRTTYQGNDFLGRPLRIYDGQLVKRLQVDSLGAAVTGALTVSGAASLQSTADITGNATIGGKAVVTDSLRVGRIATLNGGLTVQGAAITFNDPLTFSTTAGNAVYFSGATTGAYVLNTTSGGALTLGGRNVGNMLVLNQAGTKDVQVNGDLEATDSLTTGGSLIVDGSAFLRGNSWVSGRWIVGDSLRVNKVANFDAGTKTTGASWNSGTFDVGDTLRAASGLRVVGGLDVSSDNVSIRFGNAYQIRNSAAVAKSVIFTDASGNLLMQPLESTGRVNLRGVSGVVGISTNSTGDVYVGSAISVSDSVEAKGPMVANGTGVYLKNTGLLSFKDTGGTDRTAIHTAGGTNILRISPLASAASIDVMNYAGTANVTFRDDGIFVAKAYAFASLPAVVAGGILYCSDCKSLGDGAAAGSVAVGAGTGNMVFGANTSWRIP